MVNEAVLNSVGPGHDEMVWNKRWNVLLGAGVELILFTSGC